MFNKEEIVKKVEEYIDWDKGAILVMPANTQIGIHDEFKEAWREARPEDANKASFLGIGQNMVERRRSRWFEPMSLDETYAAVVATHDLTEEETVRILVRELQHCLDHQIGTIDMPLLFTRKMGMSFKSWSDFRAGYTEARVAYFLKLDEMKSENPKFDRMAAILGEMTARSLKILDRVGNDVYGIIDGMSSFMGAQKSIQALAEQELEDISVFKLWQMTPSFIIERYGTSYYHLSNAWANLETHPVDVTQKEYKDFRNYLSMKVSFKM